MALIENKKTFIALVLGFTGIAIANGVAKDLSFYENKSMDLAESHSIMRFDDSFERVVASSVVEEVATGIQIDDASLVNGKWEITRIISADNTIEFDALDDQEVRSIIVEMELIKRNIVEIDEDASLNYSIFDLDEVTGEIELRKSLGNGEEIVIAKKLEEEAVEEIEIFGLGNKEGDSDENPARGVDLEESVELSVEKAFNIMSSKNYENVTGSLSADGKTLDGTIDLDNMTISFDYAKIQNGSVVQGTLLHREGEETFSAIFMNYGENKYKLTVSTTKYLQGASFVLADMNSVEDSYEEYNYEQEVRKEEAQDQQNDVVEMRRSSMAQYDEMFVSDEELNEQRELTEEEMKDEVQRVGFQFMPSQKIQ